MENNNDFLKDWLEGKISPEQLASKRRDGDKTIQEFEELITKSSKLKVPETITKEEAWAKLSGKLNEARKPEAKVVKMNRWIPVSIAASVSLVIISFFVFAKTTITTQFAETKVYELPDGSEVTLNADSRISFRKLGWSGNRQVALTGEAFFSVKKGSSFEVETEKGTVTVLGTSFNVNARPGNFEVSCYTGRVNVGIGSTDVILTKGLSTRFKGNMLQKAEPFDENRATWIDGEFYFDQQPLSVVIDELERQFAIEIIFSGDGSRLYTGYFSRNNVDEALQMVFKPMSLNYRRENNKIIVQ